MRPYDKDHIEPPSAFSDTNSKKEYGRELAICSLMRASFESAQTSTAQLTTTEPKLKIHTSPRTDRPSEPQSTIPFPAKKGRMKKRVLLAVAASIAAAAAPLWFFTQRPTEVATTDSPLNLTIISTDGIVTLKHQSSGKTLAPVVGQEFDGGYRLATGADSSIKLAYTDGTELHLQGSSVLSTKVNPDNDTAKQLYLSQGSIAVKAAKQHQDAPMKVRTEFADAQVIGTIFKVTVFAKHTELIVTEGKVGFGKPNLLEQLIVESGKMARIGPQLKEIENTFPTIESFALINVTTGRAIPGYENLKNKALIFRSDLPKGKIGIKVNTSGVTDMVEAKHPKSNGEIDLCLENNGSSYRPIDRTINPYILTATPFSREEGKGKPETLKIRFED